MKFSIFSRAPSSMRSSSMKLSSERKPNVTADRYLRHHTPHHQRVSCHVVSCRVASRRVCRVCRVVPGDEQFLMVGAVFGNPGSTLGYQFLGAGHCNDGRATQREPAKQQSRAEQWARRERTVLGDGNEAAEHVPARLHLGRVHDRQERLHHAQLQRLLAHVLCKSNDEVPHGSVSCVVRRVVCVSCMSCAYQIPSRATGRQRWPPAAQESPLAGNR
jgi:hypothetical protein